MRELLPAKWLIEELGQSLGLKQEEVSTISTVWKDNNDALVLATNPMPRMTPRSKYIGVKYHWFRIWINSPEGKFVIKPVESSLQKADIFTKLLPKNKFRAKRKMLMGW
eukprot:7521052-Ditylum_brightwellii.AAC.1